MASPTELAFELITLKPKTGTPVDLIAPLTQYITSQYEEPGSNYAEALKELARLRLEVLQPSPSSMCDRAIHDYCAQLERMQARFSSGSLGVTFSWENTCDGSAVERSTIAFELANALFNYAATKTMIANACWQQHTRDATSLKTACTALQEAAGALDAASIANPEGVGDMSSSSLKLLRSLFLAQAQAVMVVKAATGNIKASILARLCEQVARYFDESHAVMSVSEFSKTHPWRAWPLRIRVMAMHFRSLAQWYMAATCLKAECYGEEVGRLQGAKDLAHDAIAAVRQATKETPIKATCTEGLLAIVDARLTIARRENDSIYHERVQPLGSLAAIEPASTVKVSPFERAPDAVDRFAKLVPLEVHLVASEYSEAKASIMRRINSSVEDKESELQQFLSSTELFSGVPQPREPQFPPELHQKAAMLRDPKSGLNESALSDAIVAVGMANSKANASLSDLRVVLDDTLGQGDSSMERLVQEFSDLQSVLDSAMQFDAEVCSTLELHRKNIALLSGPYDDLRKAFPTWNLMDSPLDASVTARLEELVGKIKLMSNVRKRLLHEFRQQIMSDDITTKLVESVVPPKELMAAELAKHQTAAEAVEANLATQDKLLPAVVQANAAFASNRLAIQQLHAKQDAFVEELIESFNDVSAMRQKLSQAVDFYGSFEKRVDDLAQRVGLAVDEISEANRREEDKKRAVEEAEGVKARARAAAAARNTTARKPADSAVPTNSAVSAPTPASPPTTSAAAAEVAQLNQAVANLSKADQALSHVVQQLEQDVSR